jgi:hypothetical protein
MKASILLLQHIMTIWLKHVDHFITFQHVSIVKITLNIFKTMAYRVGICCALIGEGKLLSFELYITNKSWLI